jgi:hypothetical protein
MEGASTPRGQSTASGSVAHDDCMSARSFFEEPQPQRLHLRAGSGNSLTLHSTASSASRRGSLPEQQVSRHRKCAANEQRKRRIQRIVRRSGLTRCLLLRLCRRTRRRSPRQCRSSPISKFARCVLLPVGSERRCVAGWKQARFARRCMHSGLVNVVVISWLRLFIVVCRRTLSTASEVPCAVSAIEAAARAVRERREQQAK